MEKAPASIRPNAAAAMIFHMPSRKPAPAINLTSPPPTPPRVIRAVRKKRLLTQKSPANRQAVSGSFTQKLSAIPSSNSGRFFQLAIRPVRISCSDTDIRRIPVHMYIMLCISSLISITPFFPPMYPMMKSISQSVENWKYFTFYSCFFLSWVCFSVCSSVCSSTVSVSVAVACAEECSS